MKRNWFLGIFIILLGLMFTGCGGGPSRSSKPATYSISGQILDSISKEGIANVKISCTGTQVGATDSQGNWQIVQLKGTVKVIPSHDDWIFEPQWQTFDRESNFTFQGTAKRPLAYTLSITPQVGGKVTKDPEKPTYSHGDSVRLSATPNPDWVFSHWEGNLTGGENPSTIVMTENKTITPVFITNGYLLVVENQGQGWISKNPDQQVYAPDSLVTLRAVPRASWSFSHWEGDLKGDENPKVFPIQGDTRVTAVFTPMEHLLTIKPSNHGSVEVEPDQRVFPHGTIVTLRAIPEDGWVFSHWLGALKGQENPTTLIMDGEKTLEAIFIPKENPDFSIQRAIDGAQNGETIVIPPGRYYENIDFRGKKLILKSTDPTDREIVASTIIDGNFRDACLTIDNGGEVTILGLTITNGSGKVVNHTHYGGGVYVQDSSIILRNNIITDNGMDSEYAHGGGIFITGNSSSVIENNEIIHNRAGKNGSGGGIYLLEGSHILNDNIVENNTSADGGGIAFVNAHVTMMGNIMGNNTAVRGGGIFAYSGTGEIQGNTITYNRGENGGGIFTSRGHWNITRNRFDGNDADQNGGGLYITEDSTITLVDNSFRWNRAIKNNGGAAFVGSISLLHEEYNTYEDNSPDDLHYE